MSYVYSSRLLPAAFAALGGISLAGCRAGLNGGAAVHAASAHAAAAPSQPASSAHIRNAQDAKDTTGRPAAQKPDLTVVENHFEAAAAAGAVGSVDDNVVRYTSPPRYVVGSIRNNTNHLIKNIAIGINLLDKQGRIVGTTQAEIARLAGGKEAAFRAPAAQNEAAHCEITCEIKGVTSLSL